MFVFSGILTNAVSRTDDILFVLSGLVGATVVSSETVNKWSVLSKTIVLSLPLSRLDKGFVIWSNVDVVGKLSGPSLTPDVCSFPSEMVEKYILLLWKLDVAVRSRTVGKVSVSYVLNTAAVSS